ncbi:MAG: helix-turn-helix transcriptional regulator [Chloroflexi bacterium]|nr:helix-turn-helix transcriptional regulator [Chloroflexota bacterium]
MIAKEIRQQEEARLLTAHGTLYKALDRMENAGLLSSRWEDPKIGAEAGRPRRRLYKVTGTGELALARYASPEQQVAGRLAAKPASP